MRLFKTTLVISLIAASFSPLYAQDSWESSPYNWRNSPYNWQNSKHNPKNSPSNWHNSDQNPNGIRIEGTFGRTIGYAIKREDGGLNYFDSDGDLIGFSKDGRKSYNLQGEEEKFELAKNNKK